MKTVLEQALEALVTGKGKFDAIAALKEATKQQSEMDEAIAAGDGTLHGAIDHWQERAESFERGFNAHKKLLAKAIKQKGDPVACMQAEPINPKFYRVHPDIKECWGLWTIPLYTSSPTIPEGWQLVPKEPTTEMLKACWGTRYCGDDNNYKAMLAAAPKGPQP